MAFIDWHDGMGIGMPLIDDQHKKLASLINDIEDASARKAGRAEMSTCIRKFYECMMRHFHDEEALMDPDIYPGYYEHVIEHLTFSERTMEFYKRFVDGQQVDASELLEFLGTWFKEHTTVVDQELIPHLPAKGHLH